MYFNNRLIYILHVPLLTPGRYKLYKIIPLPVRQAFDKTKYALMKTDAKHNGLNEDTDSFYKFRQGELKECTTTGKTFICPVIFPMKKIRQTPNCNIELILNKNVKTNHCIRLEGSKQIRLNSSGIHDSNIRIETRISYRRIYNC